MYIYVCIFLFLLSLSFSLLGYAGMSATSTAFNKKTVCAHKYINKCRTFFLILKTLLSTFFCIVVSSSHHRMNIILSF